MSNTKKGIDIFLSDKDFVNMISKACLDKFKKQVSLERRWKKELPGVWIYD